MLPYGNLSGRPPEEGVPVVVTPTLERPASPMMLKDQWLVKKGKRNSNGGFDEVPTGMDTNGEASSHNGLHGDKVTGLGDESVDGRQHDETHVPDKATYASVVSKGSTFSGSK
ncbi:hypothetical protein V6N13_030725 [Hibiscus sabdariffa]